MDRALFILKYSSCDNPDMFADALRVFEERDTLRMELRKALRDSKSHIDWLHIARMRTALQRSTCPMCGSPAWQPHVKTCTLWATYKEMEKFHNER